MLRLKKELRTILLPWLVSLVAVACIPSEHKFDNDLEFPNFALFVAVTSVCLCFAHTFGSEFQHRTLALLLSQPTDRKRLWFQKMILSLFVGVSVLAVYGLFMTYALLWDWSPKLEPFQIILGLFLVVILICSTCFWTLIAGSTVSGAVLSLFGLCLGALLWQGIFQLLTRGSPGSLDSTDPLDIQSSQLRSFWHAFVVVGGVIYAGGTLWLGLRKWMLMQVKGRIIISDERSFKVGFSVLGKVRMTKSSTTLNLLRKELWLLSPLFKIGGLYGIVWLLAAAIAIITPQSKSKIAILVDAVTIFYMPTILIIAGGLSVGEEKGLRMHAWHLSLPVSVWKQWGTKLIVSLGLALVFGMLLPWGLSAAASPSLEAGLQFWKLNQAQVFVVVCMCFAVPIVSFWSSCLTASTLKAALTSLVALATACLCIVLAVKAGEKFNGAFSVSLIEWLNLHPPLSPVYADAPYPVAVLLSIIFLMGQSRTLIKTPQSGGRIIRHTVLAACVVLFALCFLATDIRANLIPLLRL